MNTSKIYQSFRCEVCGNEVEVTTVGGGELICCDKPMILTTEKMTEVYLAKAFAGESQARNKYDYFAKVARKEGFEQIAGFFEETALNEKEHAKREFKFLEGIGSTAENLKAAAAGEKYEYSTMYPDFAAVAEEEGETEIAAVLRKIGEAEVAHEKRFLELLGRVEGESMFRGDAPAGWKCRNCGYVHEGDEAPDECPACAHPQKYFERLAENY